MKNLLDIDTRGLKYKTYDAIIIGSGAAGLYCALKLEKAGMNVCVFTKSKANDSSTYLAQGGIAVALPEEDSPERHLEDTIKAGAGLVNSRTAQILVEEGVKRVIDLIMMGANFDKDEYGILKFTREAAHSIARIVYAKDRTGMEIENTLINNYNGELIENACLKELIVKDERCFGIVYEKGGELLKAYSPITVIATGGIGALYLKTSNPETSTGDGIAIALRHGAILQDLEFVQFHPTAFCSNNTCFLISESVRGEGAIMIDRYGRRFMGDYHPRWELAPRDIVTRAMEKQKQICGGDIYLDLKPLIRKGINIKKRFPTIYANLTKEGINPEKDLVPITPVAHYYIGGIKIDTFGRTNIKGLFAIGEASCTGIHGANRLASNSLLECVVFGERAAYGIIRDFKMLSRDFNEIDRKLTRWKPGIEETFSLKKINNIMWNNVGIIRDATLLTQAIDKLSDIMHSNSPWEVRNAATLAVAIAISAMRREESRGSHYRKDFPYERDDFKFHSEFNIQDLESIL